MPTFSLMTFLSKIVDDPKEEKCHKRQEMEKVHCGSSVGIVAPSEAEWSGGPLQNLEDCQIVQQSVSSIISSIYTSIVSRIRKHYP